MKHKLFFLLWSAALAFFCVVVGVLALLGDVNAEIYLWTKSAIESKAGKIVWIVVSTTCLILFLALAVSEYRKSNDRSST